METSAKSLVYVKSFVVFVIWSSMNHTKVQMIGCCGHGDGDEVPGSISLLRVTIALYTTRTAPAIDYPRGIIWPAEIMFCTPLILFQIIVSSVAQTTKMRVESLMIDSII